LVAPRAAAQHARAASDQDCGMNPLDFQVIAFLNQFAHRSSTFDHLVMLIGGNALLKTGVITALLGWTWCRNPKDTSDPRPIVVFGLFASCTAVVFARLLSLTVPFRVRPLRNPDLHFVLPYSMDPQAILGWSAFPSDNATLFFGLAACIFLVSRRAGILAFCHVLLVVAFTRIYLGVHHPTDILAGALLGAGTVSLVTIRALKTAVTRVPMNWLQRHPQSFHSALFVLVFLIATTFEPLYPLATVAFATAKTTLSFTAAFYHTISLAAVNR
jgi:undecaprenyl-diphosphatase